MKTNVFSPETAQFSFYSKPVTNKRPTRVMTLSDAFQYITGVEARERTMKLRAITDAKERRAFKAREFDYAMFSGVFSYGNDNALTKHSGLICLDFDHVKDVNEVKECLKRDKYFQTQLLFTSPSGDGVKWVVPIDIDKHDHRSWFVALKNYVKHEYGLEADPSGINVSRACFLPHDVEVYINPVICPF